MASNSEKSANSFMPFYGGDYLRDTMHLSAMQDGVYVRLLVHYWHSQRALPNDRRKLEGIARCRDDAERGALSEIVGEFFSEEADGLHNKRMDHEIAEARRIQEIKSRAGKKGNEAKYGKRETAADGPQGDLLATAVGSQADAAATAGESQTDAAATATESQEPRSATFCDRPPPPPPPPPITATAASTADAKGKAKGALAPLAVRPEWLPKEWDDFERHRAESKHPLTELARKKAWEKLARWHLEGYDLKAIINDAIEAGYRGLFAKEYHRTRGKGPARTSAAVAAFLAKGVGGGR